MHVATPHRTRRTVATLFGALWRFLAQGAEQARREEAAVEPPPVPHDHLLCRLEESIQSYEVECLRHVAGARRVPPFDLAASIEETLHEAADRGFENRCEQFQLEVLEARFHSSRRRFRQLQARREQPARHRTPRGAGRDCPGALPN